MKKAAVVLLAAVFALALCACGESGTGVSSAEVSSAGVSSAGVSSAESAVEAAQAVSSVSAESSAEGKSTIDTMEVTLLAADDIPDGLPAPVSGTFRGKTVKLGLAAVTETDWQNIDPDDGTIDSLFRFSCGFAPLRYHEMYYNEMLSYGKPIYKYCYISNKGKIMGKEYSYCYPFEQNGRALVGRRDGTYVYIDTKGNEVAPGAYRHDDPKPMQDTSGVDIQRVEVGGNYKFILCDDKGNLLNERQFDYISPFYNGLALLSEDNKLGLIDKKGNIIIEPSFPYDRVTYWEEEYPYTPLYMYDDAAIIPVKGKLAVLGITRS